MAEKETKKMTPENTGTAYLIELEGQNEMNHYIEFCHGTGILDFKCYAAYRPDWVHWDAEKGWIWDGAFPPFENILDLYKKKGAKITQITMEESEALRIRMVTDPASFIPKEEKPDQPEEKEKPKAKAKGKTKDGPMPHEKKGKK